MSRRTYGALLALVSVLSALPLSAADNPAITVTVNAAAGQHAIDPRIYGSSWASALEISTLGLTLNRWGGNAMSRYNWAFSTANRCKDYYFYNIPDVFGGGANGQSADQFIDRTFGAGAHPVMTIPMLSLLPKDNQKRCSFPQASVPNQEDFATWEDPICGNGKLPGGSRILGAADPNGIATSYPLSHQGDWVQHLLDTYGSAAAGGVRYYSLDNEPHLWSADHWDVHPAGTTYSEVWGKMQELGAIIRAKDPSAVITGGEEWGWSGYFDSGIDAENGNTVDRDAHGGTPWYDWMLDQAKAYEVANGVRILDVVTVHFYPQGGEFWSSDPALRALRNRSTRALWDPNYADESWIKDNPPPGEIYPAKVRLIPRLKEWVANHYPGTKIGITEYNWGVDDDINGGTTQADILGILGREGVDLAVRWGTPQIGTDAANAFRMYRNYDGAGGKFGETSVSASAPDPDSVSAFASVRASDGALTVMLVAKVLSGNTPVTVSLAGFNAGESVQRWQMDATGIGLPTNVVPVGSAVYLTLPPQTVTLLVIPPAVAPLGPPVTAAATTTANVGLSWSAVDGAITYDVYRKSDGADFAFRFNTGNNGTTANDAADGGKTYVYEVRAVLAGGAGPFGAPDAATTILFTDDALAAGTPIKAVHFNELRTAVNAMRVAAALAPQNFADVLSSSMPVKASHVTDLRTALDAARTALGLPAASYTDPALAAGTLVKTSHVTDLRNGVK